MDSQSLVLAPAPFKIYNTLSKTVEDFKPLNEGEVKLYVCGMTVYDHIHIGHGRAMVVFDAFARYLRHRGWAVTFVRNFTDVDDKIIKRALERDEAPMALAERFIDAFHKDTDALGLSRPELEPRVSTSMNAIIDMIQRLVEREHAYINEGSVWFSVKSFTEYGKLSRRKVDEALSADEDLGKRHPADFALWKAAKPNEPTWKSPWGEGRPGWHIECSAMACEHLGEEIDIHGGGLDLVFPHHENEIAQSEAANAKTFARYWMHNGLLTMKSGQKMGKSLGNVINIHEALDHFPAEAIRLYLLQHHYRTALPWSDQALVDSLAMLARLYEAKEVAAQMNGEEKAEQVAQSLGKDALTVHELALSFKARLYQCLDDDFNTANALALAFELARAINRFSGHKKAKKRGGPIARLALEALTHFTESLKLLGDTPASFQTEVKAKRLSALGLSVDHVDSLIEQRATARLNKDWALSDQIRDELDQMGVVVMDTAEDVQWRLKL
jgi:cysteinyl-tRNA synthetase